MNQQAVVRAALFAAAMVLAPVSQGFQFFDPQVKWPSPNATLHAKITLQGNANSPSGTSWTQAMLDAAGEWSSNTVFSFNVNTSQYSHPCAGYDSYPSFPEDGLNGVDFLDKACDDNFGANTLAITFTYYNEQAGEIVESDIIFNSAKSWDVYDGNLQPVVIDMRRVALHEGGHWQGLAHEPDVPAIMAPNITDTFTLQSDDISGIQTLYDAGQGLEPIILNVESPIDGEVKSGVDTGRGWVVSQYPLESVKYYEDGVFKRDLSATDTRADVGAAYPDYPGSTNSGFAFARNWANLGGGAHTVRFDVLDSRGNTATKTISFTVKKFQSNFVDSSKVSLSGATVSKDGEDITISNLQHDGQNYFVRMRWKDSAQTYEIVGINQLP